MLLGMQLIFADINDIKELGKAVDDLSFEKAAVSGSKTAYKLGVASYTFNRPYKSGEKQLEVQYLNGKREGEAKFYYQNGTLIGKGNYKNDKKDGLWEFFTNNGGKITEVNYKMVFLMELLRNTLKMGKQIQFQIMSKEEKKVKKNNIICLENYSQLELM